MRFGIEEPLGNTIEGINVPFNPAQCSPSTPQPVEEVIPSAGTILRRRRNFAAWLRVEPGGAARSVHGISDRRPGVLIFNQELHFPMKLPWVGNKLGGTLFYDGGNVYTDVNHISLRGSRRRSPISTTSRTRSGSACVIRRRWGRCESTSATN